MNDRSRILVVDDEPLNRRLLEAILTVEGFDVVHAEDGESALALIAQGGIDLVLLDVMMPGIGGIETCRRIRSDLKLPILPVIIITALADRDSRTLGKTAGADDFLTKPVFEDELVARVRNLLLRSMYYHSCEFERARAEANARRWKLVSDVARGVATCRDYAALEFEVGRLLASVLPVSSACLFEVDGHELRPAAQRRDSLRAPAERYRRSMAPSCEQFRNAQVLPIFEAMSADYPFAVMIRLDKSRAGIAVPVFVGGALHAILAFSADRPLESDELILVEELGPHLANAVANVHAHLSAQELQRARQRFAALLVHDLKNPLSIIKMNLDLLRDPSTPDHERTEELHDCQVASERMLNMIVDLLDISRAEEGRLTVEFESEGLDGMLADVLDRYSSPLRARGIALVTGCDPELRVLFDRKLVTRVLENMLGNALRYVTSGGVIEVFLKRDGESALLQIANDGPPIAPETRSRLFEKYGMGRGGGNSNRGLGLYFCRLVVEEHGGTIGVRERDGGGVCFEIRLPLLARPQQAMRAITSTPAAQNASDAF